MEKLSLSYMGRVEKTQSSLTPKLEKFADTIYPKNEIRRDCALLSTYKNSAEYKHGEERSDAKLLEMTFIDMAEQDDWFQEEYRFGDDEEYEAISTMPTTELDDAFNHIDMIGTISNKATGNERMHFAIDLTYNVDDEKMRKKFKWRHLYGVNGSAPSDVSEFGEIVEEQGFNGRPYLRTRRLRDRFRNGLKIPGFASAKYYEDTDNDYDPDHEIGRIDLMPRFIVGYDPEIADVLAQGKPKKDFVEKYGVQFYNEKIKEYNQAKTRAKWCTLNECAEQASALRTFLDNLPADVTKWMKPDELAAAKKQAAAMDDYFGGALSFAQENANNNPNEKAGMQYAEKDRVRNAIQMRTGFTYIDGDWR